MKKTSQSSCKSIAYGVVSPVAPHFTKGIFIFVQDPKCISQDNWPAWDATSNTLPRRSRSFDDIQWRQKMQGRAGPIGKCPPPFHWLQKLHGWAEEERMHEGINVWVWMIEWTNERMDGLPFLCASSLIYWTAMSALRGFFSEEALRWARSCRSSFLATFSLGLPLYWTIYI